MLIFPVYRYFHIQVVFEQVVQPVVETIWSDFVHCSHKTY
ncbi:hypothetical protein BN440_1355 [Erwinia amylovora MR1]|nr:hypothetical protein BN440_1355 [Erwinia amylovora MR1]